MVPAVNSAPKATPAKIMDSGEAPRILVGNGNRAHMRTGHGPAIQNHHGKSCAEGRRVGNAQGKRRTQRIAQDGLHDGSGNRKSAARYHRSQHLRQTYLPDNNAEPIGFGGSGKRPGNFEHWNIRGPLREAVNNQKTQHQQGKNYKNGFATDAKTGWPTRNTYISSALAAGSISLNFPGYKSLPIK